MPQKPKCIDVKVRAGMTRQSGIHEFDVAVQYGFGIMLLTNHMKKTSLFILICIFLCSCDTMRYRFLELVIYHESKNVQNLDFREILTEGWTDFYFFPPNFKSDDISRVIGLPYDEDIDVAWTVIIRDENGMTFEEQLSQNIEKPDLVNFQTNEDGFFHVKHGMILDVRHTDSGDVILSVKSPAPLP